MRATCVILAGLVMLGPGCLANDGRAGRDGVSPQDAIEAPETSSEDAVQGRALVFEPSAVDVTQVTGHWEQVVVTMTNASSRSVATESFVIESKEDATELAWDGFYLVAWSVPEPGAVLGPNESHQLTVGFAELYIGEVDDTLIVTTDEPDGEYRIPLHGVATRCAAVPEEDSCAWTLEDDEWTCSDRDCRIICSVLEPSVSEPCYEWGSVYGSGVSIRYLRGEGCVPPEAGTLVDFVCTQGKSPDCPVHEDPCQPPE